MGDVGVSDEGLGGRGSFENMVVFFAGTPWDMTMLPDQHMAGRLARHVPVLYVDPPLSRLSPRTYPDLARSLSGPRLRMVAPTLARLTPVVPPGVSRPGLRLLAQRLARVAARRAVARLEGTVDTVVCATIGDPFPLAGERRRLYYVTDDFVAGAGLMGVDTEYLRRRERRILRRADTVVAVSPVLQETLAARGVPSHLIANGVQADAFTAVDELEAPDDVHLQGPVVGFVGQISDRIDLDLLTAVARRGHSLLLVGPHQVTMDIRRLEELLAMENVQWVGSKGFEELPRYVARMAVGVLPYTRSDFNRASFPLKVLEYLAAGRAAVSTDLPAVRWLDTPLIDVADDATSFVAHVERRLQERRTPELVAERRAFAAAHSWDRRAEQMLDVLDVATGTGHGAAPGAVNSLTREG